MLSRVAIRNLKVSRRFSTVAPKFWNKFDSFVQERPVLAKCAVGGVLAFIADIVTQVGLSDAVSKKNYDEIVIDWLRVLKFTAIGGIFVPPILHCWYGFLVARIPGVTMSSVLKRLALDQLCFAPIFLPCFISVAMILDGNASQIPAKLKADWFPTVVANYSVWVPCQFINFRYVAPHQQVLFANGVSFFWNMYLSYTCFGNADKHTPAEEPSVPSTVAKAVELVSDAPEVTVVKAKDDCLAIEKDIFANAVTAVVVESVQAVDEGGEADKANKESESVDKLGFELVEFVDLEATMPPSVSVMMNDEDARGENVVLDNFDAIVAMGVETPSVEVPVATTVEESESVVDAVTVDGKESK